MQYAQQINSVIRSVLASLVFTLAVQAADPGLPLPDQAALSDQKPGSVLIYNLITSSAAAPNDENTRITLTNMHSTAYVAVHLYAVDGVSCSVADSSICLTPNQTVALMASFLDPGVTGYLVVVAVDRATGCPINFNYLTGNAYVRLASGHEADLPAEAVAALYGATNALLPGCNASSTMATLMFDGSSYNQVGGRLAWDSLYSPANGNESLLVINRIGGDLRTGAAALGTLFGILYDDAETPHSFSLTGGCQIRQVLSDSTPHTVPPFSTVIPAQRTGWLQLSSFSGFGLLGAGINFGATTASGRFTGGHNLHKLSYTTDSYIIPLMPPLC